MDSITELFNWVFDYTVFNTRDSCGVGWSWKLETAHMATDFIIALCYFSIPAMLIYFAKKAKHFPFQTLAFDCAGFVVLCGVDHLLSSMMFFYPHYRLSAFFKILQAFISIKTVIDLHSELPRIMGMRYVDEIKAMLIENRKAKATKRINRERDALLDDLTRQLTIAQYSVDNMYTAIALFEPKVELPYIMCNEAFCELYSVALSPIDLVGMSHYEVFPDIDKEKQEYRQANDAAVKGIVTQYIGVDTFRERDFYWRVFPVFKSGEVIAVAFEIWPVDMFKEIGAAK